MRRGEGLAGELINAALADVRHDLSLSRFTDDSVFVNNTNSRHSANHPFVAGSVNVEP